MLLHPLQGKLLIHWKKVINVTLKDRENGVQRPAFNAPFALICELDKKPSTPSRYCMTTATTLPPASLIRSLPSNTPENAPEALPKV